MTDLNINVRDIEDNTEVVQAYEAMFDSTIIDTVRRDELVRLAAGTIGILRIRDLLPVQHCEAIMKQIDQCEFDVYDERRIYPPVSKVGPSAYDYYLDGSLRPEYWAHAESTTRTWRTIVGDDDPVEAIVTRLRSGVGAEVERATVGGRPLFAGMLREFSDGGRMHFDELAREFPGVFDEEPIVQFGFNCHLSVPSSGGELTVYRRRWRPDDDRFRLGYGWDQRIAENEPHATERAAVGDGVFFDSRNYHSIGRCGPGRRVTLSFFVGITLAGSLIIWS